MSSPCSQTLAGAVASECRRLGAAMSHLEGGLISYAHGEVSRETLIKEMQTIDAAQQTLEDLARMLEVLSTARNDDPDPTQLALAAIRQTAVRSRVVGLTGWGKEPHEVEQLRRRLAEPEEDMEIW